MVPQSNIGVLYPLEGEMASRQAQQVSLRIPEEDTAWSVQTDLSIGLCDPREAKWSGKTACSSLGEGRLGQHM